MENPLLKYLAFVKTAEKGSFTRAAQELNYAQSSVGKMVADLEQEWERRSWSAASPASV